MGRSIILIFTFMLAGCVTPIETVVSTAGLNEGVGGNFVVPDPESKRDADVEFAQAAVIRKLAASGLHNAPDAAYRLEVTFAALPADLMVRVGDTASGTPPPKRRKGPRKSKHCDPVDYRLGVLMSRIMDGATLYRSSAREYHCRGEQAAFIDQMVNAALADLGNPRGDYMVERPRIVGR